MSRPTGEVVLWPGRGVYCVVDYTTNDGNTCACLRGLEGQAYERDVPIWKLHTITRPLDEYPPIRKENK